MIGPGKYDVQLSAVLVACEATQGILIVFDGCSKGSGFCAQLTSDNTTKIPTILRSIADDIDKDAGSILPTRPAPKVDTD